MFFGATFGQPFYRGGGASQSTTTQVTDVAIGGHPYMIDFSAELPYHHTTVPIVRQQADQSESPGEQSINPESLWRRSVESWHLGAGQANYDRPESSPYRFRNSRGVDPHERWILTLLNDTEELHDTAETAIFLATTGTRLYAAVGEDLVFWDDTFTNPPTTVTGTPTGEDATSITSDGHHVWVAYGSNGLYKTDETVAAAVEQVSDPVTLVRYVLDRVIAAEANALYDITAEAWDDGGSPHILPGTPRKIHANDDWIWSDVASTGSAILAAGYSGDVSHIYATTLTEDATELEPPVVIGSLPHGEIIHSLTTYISQFAVIGTDAGWRFGLLDDQGGISISARVPTPGPVLAGTGFGPYIWFGWSNFDDTHTGLGRLNTALFGDEDGIIPAYSSDLMTPTSAAAQGDVTSVVTFGGGRVFAVAGAGIYMESDDLVEDGFVDSGFISFGMTEPKMGLFVDVDHAGQNNGEVEVDVSTPLLNSFSNIYSHIGASTTAILPAHLGEVTSTQFEFRVRLNRDPVDTTEAQTFNSYLFRVQPRSQPTELILLTVILAPDLDSLIDAPVWLDVDQERRHIRSLWSEQTLTTLQVGQLAHSGFVEEFDLDVKRKLTGQGGHNDLNASCFVKFKVVG